jgi:very-short-patch-repair endonuclease
LDVQIHQSKEQKDYDLERSKNLIENGITVIRFWNSEVLNHLPDVVKTIVNYIDQKKANFPSPSNDGEGTGVRS